MGKRTASAAAALLVVLGITLTRIAFEMPPPPDTQTLATPRAVDTNAPARQDPAGVERIEVVVSPQLDARSGAVLPVTAPATATALGSLVWHIPPRNDLPSFEQLIADAAFGGAGDRAHASITFGISR